MWGLVGVAVGLCTARHGLAHDLGACEGGESVQACEAAADSSSLIQRLVTEHQLQRQAERSAGFPGLGDLKGMASDTLKDVESTGIAQAVKALAGSMGGSLDGVQQAVSNFVQQVKAQRGNLTSGMAAILAKNFKLNKTDLVEGKEAMVEQVKEQLTTAVKTWEGFCKTSDGLGKTAGAALTPLGATSLKERLNVALKAASERCQAVSRSLSTLQDTLLAQASEFADSTAQDLQDRIALRQEPLGQDPASVCRSLNATMQNALDQAQDFAKTFDHAFDKLQANLGSSFANMLTSKGLSQVEDSFHEVTDKAKNITTQAMDATATFLDSLEAGVGAAGSAAGVHSAAPERSAAGALLAAVSAAWLSLA